MADADALRALLERVEAATRPDRTLGIDLLSTLWPEKYRRGVTGEGSCHGLDYPYLIAFKPKDDWTSPGWYGVADVNPTASIDALVALVARAAPDLEWLVRPDKVLGAFANLYHPDKSPNEDGPCWPAHAATPALALCAALLRALLARTDHPIP